MLDSMKSSLSTLDMSQAEESHLHMWMFCTAPGSSNISECIYAITGPCSEWDRLQHSNWGL